MTNLLLLNKKTYYQHLVENSKETFFLSKDTRTKTKGKIFIFKFSNVEHDFSELHYQIIDHTVWESNFTRMAANIWDDTVIKNCFLNKTKKCVAFEQQVY